MIGDDNTVIFAQNRDQMPKQISPGRLAMKAKNSFLAVRTLVHIMHSETGGVREMRREWKGTVKILVRIQIDFIRISH
jgi:hypothetical protein